jgi:ribosomal protein L11 methyltransferase
VSVRVARERAEEARAVMLELFPEGFEEADVDGELELAAYTTAGGEERLWQVFGSGVTRDVEAGWTEAWKRFHRPARVGALWIGPPWEERPPDAVTVVIDPGRAFGTGGHPTTQLSLELLQELVRSSLVDLGCGSGVIAIAAAKLGFAPVIALDVDEAAIETTRVNAETNGVEVEVRHADVLRDRLPDADVAVANLTLADVQSLAERVKSRSLVTSGYLAAESPRLVGWERVDRREAHGWAADLFERA